MHLAHGIQSLAGNAWMEIDKKAFEENIQELKKMVGPKTKICAVMKSDAYGNGIALLIPSIIKFKIPCVAIASNEEARLVRRGGFKNQVIRIRASTIDEIKEGFKFNLEEIMGNLQLAKLASAVALKSGRVLNIHLDFNTGGMSRDGLEMDVERSRQEALEIARLSHLKIVGIMTHFPVDEKTEVKNALNKFNEQVRWMIKEAKLDRKQITIHTANSFASVEMPESHLDMIRPGSALYGVTTVPYPQIKQIMTFKSTVAAVNFYPKGDTVSYDRTFTLARDSKLANIPVGYSDGYRRAFSNKSFVLIRGQRFPVVGRVTMNSIVVDVTDGDGTNENSVQPGDEVVLFGRQGKNEITQSELEKASDTIFPELCIGWGLNNPRILK